MPSSCAVGNCRDRYSHHEGTSFHKFPVKRKELLEKWIVFVAREPSWQPSKWSSVCSRHFRKEDFAWSTERRTLKKTAVPSVRQYITQCEGRKAFPSKAVLSTPQQGAPASVATLAAPANDKHADCANDQLATSGESADPSTPKVNCRLCGLVTATVVTFATNFEIYGTIQKCLPTLNIQQDDQLPKEMCRVCLQHLENFSRFIDKVFETQNELQRKYATSQNSSNNSNIAVGNSGNSRVATTTTASAAAAVERQLKIKQEPLAVRVKQEVAESFESSFLSSDDMDIMMGADESCCDAQPQPSPHEEDCGPPPIDEQKFQFCDFPMLNTQDIINNCDIMEIINLDDPFINIPDDDANTLGEPAATATSMPLPEHQHQYQPSPQKAHQFQHHQQQQQQHLPSAHELLQTHLLIEEHNYAYAAEDFKEEWQIKNYYKTEKTEEGYEPDEGCIAGEHEEEYAHDGSEEAAEEFKSLAVAAPPLLLPPPPSTVYTTTSLASPCGDSRSAKPIVTSVSAIAESSRRPPFSTQKQQLLLPSERPKPNIVVLNESIVKSSSPFHLHACAVCQLKFFSLESLSQHRQMAHSHQEEPMVCVPSANILANNAIVIEAATSSASSVVADSAAVIRNCKIEAGCEREAAASTDISDRLAPPLNEAPVQYAHLDHPAMEWHTQPYRHEMYSSQTPACPSANSVVAAKRQINILEMRQTFLRHAPLAVPHAVEHHSELNGEVNKAMPSNQMASSNCHQIPNATSENSVAAAVAAFSSPSSSSSIDETVFKVPNKPASTPLRQRHRKTNTKLLSKTVVVGGQQQQPKTAVVVVSAAPQTKTTTKSSATPQAVVVKNVMENYKQLHKRYRQLQRKCKSLQKNAAATSALKIPTATALPTSPRKPNSVSKFQCPCCPLAFASIYALLRHKQTATALTHRIRKPRSRFAATCSGCEKFFRSKLALRNHMRYICPTLSLRCMRQLQIQTFKCRCCRRITFTHWRLYRRHELRCKQKQLQQQQQQQLQNVKKRRSCRNEQTKRLNSKCSGRKAKTKLPSSSSSRSSRQSLQPPPMAPQYACPICPKTFASSNSLSQHRITHCSERLFKCSLCVRIFKRRNGLAQHMNGYHLQLKPYACVVCGHSYSLKCDMLRCRHSTLQRAGKRVT